LGTSDEHRQAALVCRFQAADPSAPA